MSLYGIMQDKFDAIFI